MRVIVLIFFLFIGCDAKLFSQTIETKTETTKDSASIETLPEFPGGNEALMKFISKNLKYPKSAIKDDIQGKVYVKFIVDKNGFVKDAHIAKGVREDLDKAALDVVNKMLQWKPGTQKGKTVEVKFTLPIAFRLQ